MVGSADEGIRQLAARGVRFDLAFLDADKGGYLGYYNQVNGTMTILALWDHSCMCQPHSCMRQIHNSLYLYMLVRAGRSA